MRGQWLGVQWALGSVTVWRPAMRSHIRMVALAIGLVALMPNAWAERLTLNDTGMTQCVSKQKEWVSECAKTGQDAGDGRDVRNDDPDDGNAGFSFRKVCRSGQMAGEGSCPADPIMGNGPDNWGCTYDNISELTWEMKTNDGGEHDYLNRYTNKGEWAQNIPTDAAYLVKVTNAEALCGSTEWRLPEVMELQSIVDYGGGTPDRRDACLDYKFFANAYRNYTWTGTEAAWDPEAAWFIDACGSVATFERVRDILAVRLVHRKANTSALDKPTVAKERFIPSPDGTEVTDTMTGLVWRRCAEGVTWNADEQTCKGSPTLFQWREAFDHVRANRAGGWRLPNIKELFSIVNVKRQRPSIDPEAFPNTSGDPFLSSTPVDYGPPHFKIIRFFRGAVEQQEAWKANDWALRLVRRGRK
jgi:hypothetical protein